MGKTIILLTKTFPFASGEEFLEEEIINLASQFHTIFIISTAVPHGSVQTRALPKNVKVVALQEVHSRYLKYAKYVAKGVRCFFQEDIQKELRGKTLKGKLGVVYIAGRSKSLSNKIIAVPEIKQLLSESDTILYSYWFADLPYVAILLKRTSGNVGIKIASRAHGYDLYDYRNASGYIPFRSIVMKEIDKVFPCSLDGCDYLKERYPEQIDKIEVSYLGTKDCGSGIYAKKERYHIVTCSAIIPLKRLHLLAEALKTLENKGYTCDWTCIGEGSLLENLKAYVSGNLKKCTVTFTGRLMHDEVLQSLKRNSFDLFVNVSETEGLPVSIMEAISFGIPALATDVGGTKEIVIPKKTGMLMEKDVTPEIIAEKILECKETSFEHETIRDFWNNHFNSDENYRCFTEKLQKM